VTLSERPAGRACHKTWRAREKAKLEEGPLKERILASFCAGSAALTANSGALRAGLYPLIERHPLDYMK